MIAILNEYNVEAEIDNINILGALNDYLHLINFHDNDFEQIFNSFKQTCSVTTCIIFRRNNQSKEHKKNNLNFNEQILDKMHCYFKHSYDIGHRITHQELELLNSSNFKHNDVPFGSFKTKQTVQLMNIISNKHQMYRDVKGLDRKTKYNVDVSNESQQKEDNVTEHNEHMVMFDCGVYFNYSDPMDMSNWADVKKKYSDIKRELLTNSIAVLSEEQFESELHKAQIHYASRHCKQIMTDYEIAFSTEDEIALSTEDGSEFSLQVYHLLAIMIYCNYDVLSYEFSKTYRRITKNEDIKSIANRHSNYYHLGKYLMEVIRSLNYLKIAHAYDYTKYSYTYWRFELKNKLIYKQLYHGINQELLFPLHAPWHTDMFVPLSTTTELAVSAHFSTPNGMIIELSVPCSLTSFFDCTWLSDYSNEKEHLFIQTFHEKLSIKNIILCRQNLEMTLIIETCMILSFPTTSVYKERTTISDEQQLLTIALIEDVMELKPFKTLHCYAKDLFNHFRQHKSKIRVHWKLLTGHYKFLLKYFKLSHLEWIDIEQFIKLYPNLQEVRIYDIRISDKIIHYLLSYVSSKRSIMKIAMNKLKNAKYRIKSFINKYEKQFSHVEYTIHQIGLSPPRFDQYIIIKDSIYLEYDPNQSVKYRLGRHAKFE
eukprot:399844_1